MPLWLAKEAHGMKKICDLKNRFREIYNFLDCVKGKGLFYVGRYGLCLGNFGDTPKTFHLVLRPHQEYFGLSAGKQLAGMV